MRVKCNDTPRGASSAISGSTVGLPGGTRNPIRVRHPFIVSPPHACGSTALAARLIQWSGGEAIALNFGFSPARSPWVDCDAVVLIRPYKPYCGFAAITAENESLSSW